MALSPDQRAVVVLCDVQGLSYEEVSEALHVSLGTVKSRLSRGRARLRELLLRQRELLPHPFRHTV
jgi:RNA polymerase sigma-70 factor (ECF subfamily)